MLLGVLILVLGLLIYKFTVATFIISLATIMMNSNNSLCYLHLIFHKWSICPFFHPDYMYKHWLFIMHVLNWGLHEKEKQWKFIGGLLTVDLHYHAWEYKQFCLCFSSNFNRFSAFVAVKHDCVFGGDFDLNEITYVSEVIFSFLFLTLFPTSYSYINTEISYIFAKIYR